MKEKTGELELKSNSSGLAVKDSPLKIRRLSKQVEAQLATLDPHDKTDKKKINALNKDKAALQATDCQNRRNAGSHQRPTHQ